MVSEFSTKPRHKETEAITKLQNPKTFKQLKSFIRSLKHLNKFTLKLAKLCTPLRLLLSTANKFRFILEEKHEKAFKNILEAVHNVTENRLFVNNRETQIVCDASGDGIGWP